MTILQFAFAGGLVPLAAISVLAAPPSYSQQVEPFLAKYCVECHSSKKTSGKLNLETYQVLQEGGISGPVVVPGQPDESYLVTLTERKQEPIMPPKNARQPRPEESAVLRAWVAAGAHDDETASRVADVKPKGPAFPPVTALAYWRGGQVLAAAGDREVILLDPAQGSTIGKLHGQGPRVTALAFSRNGDYLAVASGTPGVHGDVRLYFVPPSGRAGGRPEFLLRGHKDNIHAVAFGSDSTILATCGYDRLVKLWDVLSGKELRTLKDHSDAVHGMAFSPDGKLLASASADRTVKVWDVATGTRLYTLSDATDWVYAIAWSPDGKHLAAAGVDRSIRVWEAGRLGGKLLRSVFAHEGPVTLLAYTADGHTLYSVSEDRTIKSWDAARMVERMVYPKQPDHILSLAVRSDRTQLAVGRHDGAVVLFDASSGKTLAEPLPIKPKPPKLNRLTPSSGQRGQAVRILCEGTDLGPEAELIADHPGVLARPLAGPGVPNGTSFEVTFPADTPAGVYQLSLKTAGGQTATQAFTVDPFASRTEAEPNGSPTTGQKVTLPASITGVVGQPGDLDWFRFEGQAGQAVGVQVLTGVLGSKLDPVLQLIDDAGRIAAESGNGFLGYTCPRAGTYALGIRDRDYRGDAAMHYRLHVGPLPVITALFPLGLQRGTESSIQVEGVHLGPTRSVMVKVKAAADAAVGSRLPLAFKTPNGVPLGVPTVIVGEFPEVQAGPETTEVSVPGTANGRLLPDHSTNLWRFRAKKGQRLIVEVEARRLGSPIDSSIEVLDIRGQPVPRATLRCQARTCTTFRDHDSASPGIRIEAWNELAINDHVLIGNELLRIQALPKNPDDDCRFFSVNGQRVGYLDTTPTHQGQGVPIYKVMLHPPGTVFPPNGFPVITLNYRNDDGGPGYGKDSRLFFDPPSDGEYHVRVTDVRGQTGSQCAYRLTVRPPRPSFSVSFAPTQPNIWRGGAVPISVTAERIDGFKDAIFLQLENLPPGITAPGTTIPAGENTTAFALFADPTASVPEKSPPLKLTGRAAISGQTVTREATGSLPKLVDPGDIVTTTVEQEVVVRPGGEVRLTARIERRNGFAGRVPLDVRGLPHGVRVLDIGLNGILIPEKQTSRTFVIWCEPWVEPTTHPFVVLARREGQNTEHAARSVLLRVVPSR